MSQIPEIYRNIFHDLKGPNVEDDYPQLATIIDEVSKMKGRLYPGRISADVLVLLPIIAEMAGAIMALAAAEDTATQKDGK